MSTSRISGTDITFNSPSTPNANVSEKLFHTLLPNCTTPDPSGKYPSCCKNSMNLEQWYKHTPNNLWNAVSNYEGGQAMDNCTDDAFTKQCFLSQYYTYLSKNNSLASDNPKPQDLPGWQPQ